MSKPAQPNDYQGTSLAYLPESHVSLNKPDSDDDAHPHTSTVIRPRTAQACDKCRERKTKCSGERPTCVRCSCRGLICHYTPRVPRSRGPVPAKKLSPIRDTPKVPSTADHLPSASSSRPYRTSPPDQARAQSSNPYDRLRRPSLPLNNGHGYKPYPLPNLTSRSQAPSLPENAYTYLTLEQYAYPESKPDNVTIHNNVTIQNMLPTSISSSCADLAFRNTLPARVQELPDGKYAQNYETSPVEGSSGERPWWQSSSYGESNARGPPSETTLGSNTLDICANGGLQTSMPCGEEAQPYNSMGMVNPSSVTPFMTNGYGNSFSSANTSFLDFANSFIGLPPKCPPDSYQTSTATPWDRVRVDS